MWQLATSEPPPLSAGIDPGCRLMQHALWIQYRWFKTCICIAVLRWREKRAGSNALSLSRQSTTYESGDMHSLASKIGIA